MQISLMLEGQAGLTWKTWREIVAHADDWGLAGLYTSDHFVSPSPPNRNALEMILAHSYTAAHTQRVTFGPIVAPVSFRDPALLARQAAALDDLSGGRMILGVGAGWMAREHNMFGYPLGDPATRLARLAEGLEVIDLLLHSDAPANFHGKFFNLNDAEIRPRTGTTRIMVGGNGLKKTLRLAAKHAAVWNGVALTPDDYRERSAVLDGYARELGRDPGSIKRTLACFFFFGNSDAELEARFTYVRTWNPEFAAMTTKELCAALRERNHGIVGSRDEVLAQIHAYSDAGVQELMLQWFNPEDMQGIQAFAQEILPHAL